MGFVQQPGLAPPFGSDHSVVTLSRGRDPNYLRTTGRGSRYSQEIGPCSPAALVVRVTTAVTAVHGLEVLLWACAPKALRNTRTGLRQTAIRECLNWIRKKGGLND
jgi:hypothetical protein